MMPWNRKCSSRGPQATARTLGLDVNALEIRQAQDIASAFETLKGRADALYISTDPLVSTNQVRIGANERKFTGYGLLQNFILPNFYFHCTTAYDILRHCGVELGKRDFMGTPVNL
jgi:hypothetical protein